MLPGRRHLRTWSRLFFGSGSFVVLARRQGLIIADWPRFRQRWVFVRPARWRVTAGTARDPVRGAEDLDAQWHLAAPRDGVLVTNLPGNTVPVGPAPDGICVAPPG